jgi:hypothetical protein
MSLNPHGNRRQTKQAESAGQTLLGPGGTSIGLACGGRGT